MPSWDSVLSEKERRAVVRFVMTKLVADRDFQDTEFEEYNVIDYGKQVPTSPESIEAGREVFLKSGKCVECHGPEGRGDGNATQKDEWGFPILPADLHKCWNFRGNRRDPYNPANVFREVSTGLNGTPMPSFGETLSIEERWHVANFVISLCERKDKIPGALPMAMDPLTDKPVISFVVKSLYTEGEIPGDFDDPEWQRAPATFVGFGSQIIHKPRNFVRLVDDVWVRSLYTDNEIAYKFEWNDRNKSEMEPEAKKKVPREIPPAGDPVAKQGVRNWPVFNDGIAIQFPAKWQSLSPPVKPRFIFGDSTNSADIWKWESDGSITEYIGTGALEPLEARPTKNVNVPAAEFKNGQWRVIMKRALTTDNMENDVQFETGKYIPTTFFAWDGHNGDHGLKMSISTWYYTILEPPVPNNVFVYPFIVVAAVIGLEWWVRAKFGKNNGDS
jgi:mono/diheme cytochrome c family protein